MVASLLALALAATPDHVGDQILAMCEPSPITEACRGYILGFVEATAAHEELVVMDGPEQAQVTCMPKTVDVERVREALVKAMKARTPHQMAGRLLALSTVQSLYDCPPHSKHQPARPGSVH